MFIAPTFYPLCPSLSNFAWKMTVSKLRWTTHSPSAVMARHSCISLVTNLRDSCAKEYRNSAIVKCLANRDPTKSKSFLCCYWMDGMDAGWLSRGLVGVWLDNSVDSLYACKWPSLQTIAEWENDPCGAIWLRTILVWLSMVRVLFIINVSAAGAFFFGWRSCSPSRHH